MNSSKSMSAKRVGIRVLRMLACLVLVAAITWIAFSVLHVNALIVGFAYVLAVLVVAASWGLTESFVTSIAATLCLNYYFLPPVLSFTIADPQNWVALFAFMVTAITASKLSASVRNRAAEAQARRIEVERLYQLSLSLMLIDSTSELGPQVAASVRTQSGFFAVAFCDRLTGEIHAAGVEDQRIEHDMLRSVAIGEAAWFVSRKALTPAGECWEVWERSAHHCRNRPRRQLRIWSQSQSSMPANRSLLEDWKLHDEMNSYEASFSMHWRTIFSPL
jgi:K+-sensing histidine kinase KdpD